MRTKKTFAIDDASYFKAQLLNWASRCQEIAWLDSNDYPDKYSQYDAILAINAFTAIRTDHYDAFDDLQEYQSTTDDWIFGYLSYDLKNDTEELSSENFDGLQFPALYFFQPQKLFLLKGNSVELCYLRMVDDELDSDMDAILNSPSRSDLRDDSKTNQSIHKINLSPRISMQAYLEKVERMLAHIGRGDIYEANFCQEFFATNAVIEPIEVYKSLNSISSPPMAVYLRLQAYHLLCASPERYLKKSDRQLISQPIKGTAPRGETPMEDEKMKIGLQRDPKELAENVMIVDLVRNDLSRTAEKGSVDVTDLYGAYSFKQVHQLISTVTSTLRAEVSGVEAIRQSFPMGSMTGAPKIAAMKIIEQLEETKRGVYSGAVGYFTPTGDFDFNVVIRSILYNANENYVSFSVGSAITAGSVAQKEYEECMVKARAMRKVLEG